MTFTKTNPRTALLVLMTLLAAVCRLLGASDALSPLANFTPIGAMALFGGCYFRNQWKAFAVPLAALWLSDIFLNRFWYFDHWVFFYGGFGWVYASFAFMVLVGQLIKKVSVRNVALAAITAALTHWLITDFGAWLGGCTDITTGQLYTRDAAGLIKCYYLALPFMKNMLLGNLLYGAVLFGSFEWMRQRYPALNTRLA